MRKCIYIEGGGAESKDLHSRCREGFQRLLKSCGFTDRMPRLVSCGGRDSAFDDFKNAHAKSKPGDYNALWIDSEDPMSDIEKAWDHLRRRDGWLRPQGATDDQVLLMVTCMETWIASDRATLQEHYGAKLQTSGLPSVVVMETRRRQDVQNALVNATRGCSNAYTKGRRSFEILGKLNPTELRKHLPSFVRCERILCENL